MCNDGRLSPGLIRDGGVPTSATGRGEARVSPTSGGDMHDACHDQVSIEEVPKPGLWSPGRESTRLQLEDAARTQLASRGLLLISAFISLSLVALTWVTLAGKSTDVMSDYLKYIANSLFGISTLVAGYYFGRKSREGETNIGARVTEGTQHARPTQLPSD